MGTKRIKYGNRSVLKAEQKVAFVLLLFLGFGGAYFGFRSFGANLYRPIQIQFAKYYTGESLVDLIDNNDEKEIEALKSKDTDFDGLMDYDELYIYKTSPYLADSDSDTFDDKTEVFSGNDPNCPEGKSCISVSETTEDTSDTIVENPETVEDSGTILKALQTGDLEFSSKEELKSFLNQASLDDIRATLLNSGLTEEQLVGIDDDMLRVMFNKAIDESIANGAFDPMLTTEEGQIE